VNSIFNKDYAIEGNYIATKASRIVNNKYKLSRHIIILPQIALESIWGVKSLIDRALIEIGDKSFCDLSVYKKTQMFRLPFCKKVDCDESSIHYIDVDFCKEYINKHIELSNEYTKLCSNQ